MDISQMEYVLAVAKYRNFSQAAENCYISQSSLSQHIAGLEKELGIRLFSRTTRTIQITEAGEAFVKMASDILRDTQRLKETMFSYSDCQRGTINIGSITALETIHFNRLISDFYSIYPQLTLNIYTGKSISLLESLEKREIDVAFVAQPANYSFPNISFKPMGIDEYVILMSHSHPLAAKDAVDFSELKNERFIVHGPNQALQGYFLQACKEANFVPNVIGCVESTPIMISLIRTGLGICVSPAEETDYFSMQGIAAVRLSKPIYKRIMMATLNRGEPSHLVSLFLKFVEDWKYTEDEPSDTVHS